MSRNEMTTRQAKLEAFGRLIDILDELREKCPWDRKQTMESLRPQTIEETYELSDAIMHSDLKEISKELGDLLLHVVFYAKIGAEQGEFDIVDVINRLCDKLVYRHPHVFGDVKVSGSDEVVQNWEELKTKEKDGNKRVLSGVPVTLPPLLKAYRMQDKARAVGFDWEQKDQVWDKVAEELGEFRTELAAMEEAGRSGDREQMASAAARAENELGDYLFSIVNAARLYDLNPDTALEKTCAKFRSRFTYLEEHTIRQGRSLKDMTLAEMDEIWEEAKKLEKRQAAPMENTAEKNTGRDWLERTELLVGRKALDRMTESVVVIAGLGGVGAYAAEIIVRAGVGNIVIIDSDVVSNSNRNRQLLAKVSTLGRQKCEVMEERLLDINPALNVIRIPEYLTEENAGDTIAAAIAGFGGRIDFLIDAIDTLAPKIALISYCYRKGIPLVSSMGSGAKLDATKVRIADLSKSYNCPLAYMIRKRLRKEGISKGFPVVFSEELPEREAIVPTDGERNKKSQVGTISYLPAVFGCICAQVAIRHITGK